MLLSLHVKNLALIEEEEVTFTDGLNILTGETGAGKSIIIGSINMALGARADRNVIRTGTDYALIDIALIPGMAFDASGHRLGRGRGYYDRFLNSQWSMVNGQWLIGLCFDFQKVPVLPSDDHDIPVDIVI